MMRIEDNAIADDREFSGPHDAGRQQIELIDLVVDDERMPGIVAALKAHHDVGLERQPIDDLAFSLVAPLSADHHHIRHGIQSPCAKVPSKGAAKNKPGATATAAPGPLRERGTRFSRWSKGLSGRLGNQADLTLGKRYVQKSRNSHSARMT